MVVKEYGAQNPQTIILLHGGGLSWWSCTAAQLLMQRYHVLVPVLDGHAGSDRRFTTIEDNAAELREYIAQRLGGSVLAIGGLSLGGQILTELLAQKGDICRCALIESALVKPMPVTERLIAPAIKMSYGLIKKPWFARLQFKQLRIRPDLYEDYYADTCKITRESMIAFLQCNAAYSIKPTLGKTGARVTVAVGGREQAAVITSAKLLHKAIAGSSLLVLPGYYHGELSINHPQQYAEILENMLAQ